MNIKYKDLSIIGKVWSIAELFYAGIRDNNKKYIEVAFSKLESLKLEDIKSNAMVEDGIANLIINAKAQKQFMQGDVVSGAMVEDGSIIETVWFDCIEIQGIKNRVKNDSLLESDIDALNDIYYEIHSLWISDLKNKELLGKERRDLFKIKEEVKSYKEKIEKRAEQNQITII